MQGGCHCQKIRYQLAENPFDGDYCYCRDCQKATGMPVTAWMDVKLAQLNWLTETPTEYASSAFILRGFCNQCGCSISYRSSKHPDYISLSIASLDDPNLVAPNYHIYTASKPSWLTLNDDKPKYPKARG